MSAGAEFRPDYQRIRRHLLKGGVLQREVIEPSRTIVWHTAQRDGRFFDADTCEWLRMRPSFRLDTLICRLIEGPPTIFRKEYLTETED